MFFLTVLSTKSAFGQSHSDFWMNQAMNQATGLHIFALENWLFFAYSTMLFINETWEVFSMLAPNPALPISLYRRLFYEHWGIRLLLFFLCLHSPHRGCQQSWTLPQSFFFLYCLQHRNIVSDGLSAKREFVDYQSFISTFCKALWEGFNVCKHHKCFILPMHRLFFFLPLVSKIHCLY